MRWVSFAEAADDGVTIEDLRAVFALEGDLEKTLAMTGVNLMTLGISGGKLVPGIGTLISGVQTATLLSDTARLGVEEKTRQIEGELIVIHRSGEDLKRFFAEANRYPRDSEEYRTRRSLYYKALRRHLVEELQQFPTDDSRMSWRFLATATTSDPAIVMKEFTFLTSRLAATKLLGWVGKRAAKLVGFKETIRWKLNEPQAASRSITRERWQDIDRFSRRIAGVLEKIALSYAKKPFVAETATVLEHGLERGITFAVQYQYRDCFDAILVWIAPTPITRPDIPQVVQAVKSIAAAFVPAVVLEAAPAIAVIAPVATAPEPPPSQPVYVIADDDNRRWRYRPAPSSPPAEREPPTQSERPSPRAGRSGSGKLGHAYGQAKTINATGWKGQ